MFERSYLVLLDFNYGCQQVYEFKYYQIQKALLDTFYPINIYFNKRAPYN